MTKKERIRAVLKGERPDKLPYSFWTHMPGVDLDPVAISEKTWEFYKKYDMIKQKMDSVIYMESRIDKFSNEVTPSRSARNARLYKEVYGKYDNLNYGDQVPIGAQTDNEKNIVAI